MKMISSLFAVAVLSTPLLSEAKGREDFAKHRAARQECFQELGMEKPDRKSGEHLTPENREKLHACLASKGITPPKPGERPMHRPPPKGAVPTESMTE